MGLRFANGPHHVAYGTAGSAFSAGDPLVHTAGSLLSGVPLVSTGMNPAAGTIVGVALADSDDTEPYPLSSSGRTQVPFLVADRDTIYWSDLTADSTSSFSVGTALDMEIVNSVSRVIASTNTPFVKIAPGGAKADIDQSNQSRVLVKFDPSVLLYQS